MLLHYETSQLEINMVKSSAGLKLHILYVIRQFMNPVDEGTKTVVVEVNDKKESFCKILKMPELML